MSDSQEPFDFLQFRAHFRYWRGDGYDPTPAELEAAYRANPAVLTIQQFARTLEVAEEWDGSGMRFDGPFP